MGLFVFAVAYVILVVVAALRVWLRSRTEFAKAVREGTRLPRKPRPDGTRAAGLLRAQVILAAVMVFLFLEEDWRLADLGLQTSMPVWLALGEGALAGVLFNIIFDAAARATGIAERIEDAGFALLRSLWPRRPDEKCFVVIAVCAFNPFTEVVLFRGVLIFAWGLHLGDFTLPIAVGYGVALITHVFHGPILLWFYGAYFAAEIAVLLSPLGLAGAIGMHLVGDVAPVATLRRQFERWRGRRRGA